MSRWLPVTVFVLASLGHATYSSRPVTLRTVCLYDAKGRCIEDREVGVVENRLDKEGFRAYVRRQDYFLSYAYALALGFAAYALTRWRRSRVGAAAGAAAGVGIGSVLAAGGCFLVGCCGSPLLPVWLGLFGAKASGLAKPLVAAVTTLSVGTGVLCLRRACATGCCDGEEAI